MLHLLKIHKDRNVKNYTIISFSPFIVQQYIHKQCNQSLYKNIFLCNLMGFFSLISFFISFKTHVLPNSKLGLFSYKIHEKSLQITPYWGL